MYIGQAGTHTVLGRTDENGEMERMPVIMYSSVFDPWVRPPTASIYARARAE